MADPQQTLAFDCPAALIYPFVLQRARERAGERQKEGGRQRERAEQSRGQTPQQSSCKVNISFSFFLYFVLACLSLI